MKSRNGFVSNSSSSSFIIAYKDDSKVCPTCGHKDSEIDTIKTILDNTANYGESGSWEDYTPDKMIERLCEDYCYDDEKEEEEKKINKKINGLADKGYKFAVVTVDPSNVSVETIIGKSKNIKQLTDYN